MGPGIFAGPAHETATPCHKTGVLSVCVLAQGSAPKWQMAWGTPLGWKPQYTHPLKKLNEVMRIFVNFAFRPQTGFLFVCLFLRFPVFFLLMQRNGQKRDKTRREKNGRKKVCSHFNFFVESFWQGLPPKSLFWCFWTPLAEKRKKTP